MAKFFSRYGNKQRLEKMLFKMKLEANNQERRLFKFRCSPLESGQEKQSSRRLRHSSYSSCDFQSGIYCHDLPAILKAESEYLICEN